MASEREELEALRKQVALQCRAVAWMASALAGVQEDKGALFEAGHLDELLHVVGEQTAEQMEILGDILNGMDAVSDEDDWLTPVFEEAHRRFPTPEAPHLREVNAALVGALREAQSALALMVSPDAIRQSTVSHAFAQATAADAKARAALARATTQEQGR